MSTNIAYGQVRLELGAGKYEHPDKIRSGQGNYELTQHSADDDDECSDSKQAASAYSMDEDTGR